MTDPKLAASQPRPAFFLGSSTEVNFDHHDFEIRELLDGIRPYHLKTAVPLVDPGPHDSSGVRMALLGGKLHDHPVAQAQYGLHLIEAHRLTKNGEYLNRARKQAQRLVDRRVLQGDGWFYPYPFRHRLHRTNDVYPAPWYSMMAQGQALSVFCRLFTVTGEARWRTAADATFRSYLVAPVAGKPWGVYVVDGKLWLEEYPNPRGVTGDRTYNGHTFSAYGLWDYWVVTKDERAKMLLQGALTTTRDVYSEIANPQWRSKYCLRHSHDAGTYHSTHIGQQIQCFAITGDTAFARIADLFYTDFPPHGITGKVMFQPGDHTGYRFDGNGAVTASKPIRLLQPREAASKGRVRVKDQRDIWYEIGDGDLAGYHVKEVPGHSYQLGEAAPLGYRIPRLASIALAPVEAYTIDAAGAMTSVVTNYRVGDRVSLDRRAVLNGTEHLRLANGPHVGRWVRYSAMNRT
ncbi:D-glucuronyl C5-epimerase family protein [Plantactinospora solaniradicis]|uniref:D-glucuronyl C5-epimerase family protein n=1 Tax=Plantactinospora solaniradicis TaxID=1723736 RepID=A0ABW1K1J1_9ACTN